MSCCFAVHPARAAGTPPGDRFVEDGVSLRLLAGAPGADGRFKAALLVDLDPGWKTYWLDPGAGGLPPKLAASDPAAIPDLTLRFPAPHRADDGGDVSNVYSTPFAVAIEGSRAAGAAGLGLKVTLGICRTICVPVAADLEAPFAGSGGTAAIERAFAALPKTSTKNEGIVKAAMSADRRSLLLEVRAGRPAADAELFVAGPKGWSFGPPRREADEPDAARFALRVLARPRKGPDVPDAVTAILVDASGAFAANALPVGDGG